MKRVLSILALLLFGALLAWPQNGTSHSISLNWTASTTSGVTYTVYRGTVAGGPYTKLASGVAAVTYADTSGAGGTKYFYVVTAVDAKGNESAYSNEANATMLTNPNPPAGLQAVAQ